MSPEGCGQGSPPPARLRAGTCCGAMIPHGSSVQSDIARQGGHGPDRAATDFQCCCSHVKYFLWHSTEGIDAVNVTPRYTSKVNQAKSCDVSEAICRRSWMRKAWLVDLSSAVAETPRTSSWFWTQKILPLVFPCSACSWS